MTTISFFEEFPDERTLDKIVKVDFDTNIYLAAKDLSGFYRYAKEMKNNPYVQDVFYWPILEEEEGYWISPWSERQALERVFEEVKERNNKEHLEVMLDLEMPLNKPKILNFFKPKKNKEYISDFIKNCQKYNVSITTVEKWWLPNWLLKRNGLSYSSAEYGNKQIKMFYSSFGRKHLPVPFMDWMFKRKMKKFRQQGIIPAIGCIDVGIHGNEPINNPEILKKELSIIKQQEFSEVVIFRLSGLISEYIEVIKYI